MKLTTFIKTYARYHHNSTETIFELDDGNFIIFRPCTQTYDRQKGLWWDSFRELWIDEPEDYIGVFNNSGELYAIVNEYNQLYINPEFNSGIINVELEEN